MNEIITNKLYINKNCESIMHQLFDTFHRENIRYCVFKSTINIRLSFCARSDFDIFMNKEDKQRVYEIFKKFDLKQFESPRLNNYPGVENWIAFDEKSGNLYHIHLHYKILTGVSHAKEYWIFWDTKLLDNAVFDKDYGVMRPAESWELLLLITRIVLKGGELEYFKAKQKRYVINKEMKRELQYLLTKVDIADFISCARSIYDRKTVKILQKVVQIGEITSELYIELYCAFKREYKDYKRMSVIRTYAEHVKQEIITKYAIWNKRLGGFFIAKKKRKNGVAIAFVGVDGSGKSRLVEEIYNWLSFKIETQKLYLGAGEGRSKYIQKARDIKRKYDYLFVDSTRKPDDSLESFISKLIDAGISLEIAYKNRNSLVKMNKYRRGGGCCVMDRFPQLEEKGFNDGLKIIKDGNIRYDRIWNYLAVREKNCYEIVKKIKPDIIFRLNIGKETCISRKQEHLTHKRELERKLERISKFSYEGVRIIEIDAEQSYSEELKNIKKVIWGLF